MTSRTYSQAYSTGPNIQRMMETTQGGVTFPLPILRRQDPGVLQVPAGLDLWRRGPTTGLIELQSLEWPKWLQRFITKSFKLTVEAQFELLDPGSESMSPKAQEVARTLGASAAGALLMTVPDREATDGSVRPFQLVTSNRFVSGDYTKRYREIELPPMDWLALVPITSPNSDVVQWRVCVPTPDTDGASPSPELDWPQEVASCEAASRLLRGLSGVATRSQLPAPAVLQP